MAAGLTNSGSDAPQLPRLLQAVKSNTGKAPEQVVFEQLAGGETELLVSLGREGKQQVRFYAERKPLHAAMAAKLRTPEGRAAYRKRKWIAEPPYGWIKSDPGSCFEGRDGGGSCSEIKEERAARGKRGTFAE